MTAEKDLNMTCRDALFKRFFETLQPGDDLADGARPSATTCSELACSSPKRMTMIYLLKQTTQEVLLGHKARGFGAGNWNAFGGKVEYDEDVSLSSSAARELEEESGLVFPRGGDDLEHVGVLYFRYPQQSDPKKEYLEVHLFAVNIDTTPPVSLEALTESDEMNPIQWFPIEHVPLEKMWCDDKFWLKPLLTGLCEVWGIANPQQSQHKRLTTSFRLACFFQFFEMNRIDYFNIVTTTNQSSDDDCRDDKVLLVDCALVELQTVYQEQRAIALG
ncbi:NUDIX hydrolase, putative, partial [Bodo saltans]